MPRGKTLLTPAQRSERARIGGYALAASHDSRETSAAGRAAFMARFERQVDPEGILSETERQRRATAARKAYFGQLRLKALKGKEAKRVRA